MRLFQLAVAAVLAVLANPHGLALSRAQSNAITISGQVLAGEVNAARPVRRARISLTGGSLGAPRVAQTDTAGRYSFEVPPGVHYLLTVDKPGFVTASSGPTSDGIIRLVAGAAIQGRVTDSLGELLDNVTVSVFRASAGPDTPLAKTGTDDLGRFRIGSLAEGDYVLSAETDAVWRGAQFAVAGKTGPPRPTRVYFPSSLQWQAAARVHLAAGSETDGVSISLPVAVPTLPGGAVPQPTASGRAAQISGRVSDADTNLPVAGAVVVVSSAQMYGSRVLRTDGQGLYLAADLPAGQLHITVDAPRFVPYSRSVEVRLGVSLGPVDIALSRPAGIDGTVVDEFGDPAPGISVQLLKPQFTSGRQRLMTDWRRPTIVTDDRGRFRLPRIAPGTYALVANAAPFAGGNAPAGFAPTYYPGTSDPGAAAWIEVGSHDLADFALQLQPAQTANVSGVVIDASGQSVADCDVVLLPTQNSDTVSLVQVAGTTAPDGTFGFRDVPAGSYVVEAKARSDPEFGSITLQTASRDIERLIVKVSPGATARGRIILDGDPASIRADEVRLYSSPADVVSSSGSSSVPVRPSSDWSFEIPGLFGRGLLTASLPPTWTVERVVEDGRDVTDGPIDFRTGNIGDVEIMLMQVPPITGSVRDDRQAAVNRKVVIFAAESDRWTNPSRSIASGNSGTAGAFRIRGLPPGDYLAIALPTTDPGDIVDPAFLETLRPYATSVTLPLTQPLTLALKPNNP